MVGVIGRFEGIRSGDGSGRKLGYRKLDTEDPASSGDSILRIDWPEGIWEGVFF